jgi:hypothetical protein
VTGRSATQGALTDVYKQDSGAETRDIIAEWMALLLLLFYIKLTGGMFQKASNLRVT